MTEPSTPPGRIDLRAVEPPDPQRVDRVVGVVTRRIAALPPRSVPVRALDVVGHYARPALAAAALVAAAAASLVVAAGRRPTEDPAIAALSSWLSDAHAPTNGELLAVFAGYAR